MPEKRERKDRQRRKRLAAGHGGRNGLSRTANHKGKTNEKGKTRTRAKDEPVVRIKDGKTEAPGQREPRRG